MGQNYSKPKPHSFIAKIRHCLMCRTAFSSEGPHNRVCRRCRASQVWRDGC